MILDFFFISNRLIHFLEISNLKLNHYYFLENLDSFKSYFIHREIHSDYYFYYWDLRFHLIYFTKCFQRSFVILVNLFHQKVDNLCLRDFFKIF